MPVLGSASSGSGTRGRGYSVPVGSPAATKAALAAAASTLVEFAFFGDSTTAGAAQDGTYSWVDQVKARIIAAGLNFGGHGMYHPADALFGYTWPAPEQPSAVATPNIGAWTGGSATCPIGWNSVNSGETITFTFTGTQVRLNFSYAPTGSRVSYAIDGGTATALDTLSIIGGISPYVTKPVLISGLSSGTHTLTVTNVGPSTIRQPVATVDTGTTSGTIPLLGTGGVLAIGRLATGTPDGTKFVRDDGTLATPSSGGSMLRAMTVDPAVGGSIGLPNGSGHAAYMRIIGPGSFSVSSLNIGVATAAGNLSVAVYRDNGSNAPGTLVVGTASVACPSAGVATIALGSTVTINQGDWLAISGDNTSTRWWGYGPTQNVATWRAVQSTATVGTWVSNPTVSGSQNIIAIWS